MTLSDNIQQRIAQQLGEALCKIIIRDVHIEQLEAEIKRLKEEKGE